MSIVIKNKRTAKLLQFFYLQLEVFLVSEVLAFEVVLFVLFVLALLVELFLELFLDFFFIKNLPPIIIMNKYLKIIIKLYNIWSYFLYR